MTSIIVVSAVFYAFPRAAKLVPTNELSSACSCRLLTAVSVYVPTGEAGTERQQAKYGFLDAVEGRLAALRAGVAVVTRGCRSPSGTAWGSKVPTLLPPMLPSMIPAAGSR